MFERMHPVDFKNEYMIFKVKQMTKLRHKGARCDQAQKSDAIKTLNLIYGENKYDKSININKNQLCVMQEFVLRLLNKQKKNGKVWYEPRGWPATQ